MKSYVREGGSFWLSHKEKFPCVAQEGRELRFAAKGVFENVDKSFPLKLP